MDPVWCFSHEIFGWARVRSLLMTVLRAVIVPGCIWEVAASSESRFSVEGLDGPAGECFVLAVNGDGFAAGFRSGDVVGWRVGEKKVAYEIKGRETDVPVCAISILPSQSKLLVGYMDGTLWMADPVSLRFSDGAIAETTVQGAFVIHTGLESGDEISRVCRPGSIGVAARSSIAKNRFDAETNAEILVLDGKLHVLSRHLQVSESRYRHLIPFEGNKYLGASGKSIVVVRPNDAWSEAELLSAEDEVWHVDRSLDANRILAWDAAGVVTHLNISEARRMTRLKKMLPHDRFTDVLCGPEGTIVSTHRDSAVRVWDPNTSEKLFERIFVGLDISAVAVSEEGGFIVLATRQKEKIEADPNADKPGIKILRMR
jgi:hypothetical protein